VNEWKDIHRIAATDRYTVGITYKGDIYLTGSTPFVPSAVDNSWRSPVSIAAASTHLTALYEDGTVKTTSPQMQTEHWNGVRAIAAHTDLTVGLCYGGQVLAATASEVNEALCKQVADWRRIVDIGCGDGYIAGLTAEGQVLIARNDTLPYMMEAERWQGILTISCGARHLVALSETGQVLSACDEKESPYVAATHFVLFRDVRQLYGYGQYSRRLQQELQSLQTDAQPIQDEIIYCPSGRSAKEIAFWAHGRFALGMAHALWLDADGGLHQEGANDCGQCDLPAYAHAIFVAAGPYRSAAILEDGRIVMAGRNNDGQGDAEALNREAFSEIGPSAPPDEDHESVQGSDSVRWTQISCGHTHTAALREDGRVFAVGADPDGRCATAEWRDITHLCCGVRHTVGLRADGSCVAVGDNRYGQCNVTDWNSVVSIAAGEFHTVGLCANGRLLATGDNRKGQCDLADLEDVVAIACLPEATLCVLSSGRVVLRGGTGELNHAVDALRDVIGVSACEHRIAAMTATGELIILPE
jgi:alpha-tubulin suppressor-like RCC1 family protein